jgi:hypothetical protein
MHELNSGKVKFSRGNVSLSHKCSDTPVAIEQKTQLRDLRGLWQFQKKCRGDDVSLANINSVTHNSCN